MADTDSTHIRPSARGEDLYHLVFHASLDGMALVDRSGLVVDVNAALGAIDGYVRDEVIGDYPPRFRDPDKRAVFLDIIARVMEGETVEEEVFLQHRDGSKVPVETRSTRIDYRGEPHMLVVLRDLRERTQREGELRRSQDLYRAMFDASLDGLVVLDADGRVVDVNPALLRVDGFTREDLLGEFPPTFRDAKLHPVHARYVQTVLERGSLDTEADLLRKDGSRYTAEMRSVRVDFRHEPHILVVVRDISERREREFDLQQSEEQYRTVFKGMIDGLALIRADGIVVDVNQAMLDLDGFDRDELIDKLPPTYIGDDRKVAAHREYVRRVLAGERVKREFRFERKDGTNYDAEVRPIRINYNDEPHVLLVIRDISEQKQAAAESERLQAQLRQAQKMEAIGHLTGGIAHDFNNILTSTLGYITLARDQLDDAQLDAASNGKLGRYLDRAARAGDHARDLIAQMMTFSRGQQGERKEIELAALVDEVLTLLESSLPASVEMASRLPEALPTVTIDPVHFEQILVNLCINARDAMEGNGSLTVALAERRCDGLVCAACRERFAGHFVELSVTDTGPGIDPKVVERMFEPFYTTKEIGKGSGMGLSTVHGIVHDHDGHTLVESVRAEGTTMRVLLPVSIAPAAPERAAAPSPEKVSRTVMRGSVLVVDDNRDVGEYIADLLDSWGLEVTVINDPVEADGHLARDPTAFDLVITDQTMPRLSGLELARSIVAKSPELPVILYTGYSESVTEDIALAAGVRAYLHKPLDTAQLWSLIRETLG